MFYVYEWFIKETGEVIYVGKGSNKRYLSKQHNSVFKELIRRFNCGSRIVSEYEKEEDAFQKEFDYINELKAKGQCVCNIHKGGYGGGSSNGKTKRWTKEERQKYSEYNIMKSAQQRQRMSENNPMKNPRTVEKVNSQKRIPIIVGNKKYQSAKSLAKDYNKTENAVREWAKKGYTPFGEKCFYEKDGEKENWKELYEHRHSTNNIKIIIDNKLFNSYADACIYLNTNWRRLKKYISENKPIDGHICMYANQQPSRGNSDKSTAEGSTTNE